MLHKTTSKLSGESHMIAPALSPVVLSTESLMTFFIFFPPWELCNLSRAFIATLERKKKKALNVISNVQNVAKIVIQPLSAFMHV